eukprot:TRINITY_DN1076_c4_g1_i1.p1 TRINITY_DN1076_c4_g1~~TRINITY_DN1076_c4_g1_i1.p1  ORF type:complete len:326 (+),score=60.02 TRINITY_DN1076_c4_g1_i1:140-979(+)
MIQVDVFWSYAMGAFFACCAGPALVNSKNTTENWYFAYTIMFLSLIFAPSGVFLLSRNPGWESMFVFDRESFGARKLTDAFIPTAFGFTNVALGLLGFWVSRKLMAANRRGIATYLWMSAYMGMFSILGFGYGRFLYQGTIEDWRAGKQTHIKDIFTFEITQVILAMGIFVAPGLLYPVLAWQSQLPSSTLAKDRRHILMTFFVNLAVMTAGYQVYLGHYGEAEKQRILTGQGCHIFFEEEMGVQAPCIMNIVVNTACTLIFVGVAFITPGRKASNKRE